MTMNKELEKLKKSADLSQNLLIDKVEALVRSEYDRALTEKEIRDDVLFQINKGLTSEVAELSKDIRSLSEWSEYTIGKTVQQMFYKIGDIIKGMQDDQKI